jgi:hypothetical protein
VVTPDADIAELRDIRTARMIAIPPSKARADIGDHLDNLDPVDPDDRAVFLAAEFAECTLPDGMSRDEFLAIAGQVAEELWHGEPDSTREQALALLAEGNLDRHDILHALARHELSRRN